MLLLILFIYKKNYWLSVDVTKSSPFRKIRTVPREGLISSIVVFICLAATAFEIISSKKVRTKRQKTTKKGSSRDVLSNFKIKTNVELVPTCVLAKYIEHDQRKTPLSDISKRYIKDLGYDIKQNDLKNPIILAICKKTERAYVYMREIIVWLPL